MKGLLYKNVRQSRFYVIISFAAPILLNILLVIMLAAEEESFDLKAGLNQLSSAGLVKTFYIISIFVTLSMTLSNTMTRDEMKKWAYFITSTPKMAKGQVFSRYTLIVLICVIATGMSVAAEYTFELITEAVINESYTNNTKLILALFWIILIFNAIELPFLFRFGTKMGALIRALMGLAVILSVSIYLLFGPLPSSGEEFVEGIFEFINDFLSGNTPKHIKTINRILPFAAIGSTVVSYFISCKCYLKGIEHYDK